MSGVNIPLEGRTRLPVKIQDCIQDCGLIISHVKSASRSNQLLGMAIKNFSSLDSSIQQSFKNLQKLDALLETISLPQLSASDKYKENQGL